MWETMVAFFEEADWECHVDDASDPMMIEAEYEDADVGAWTCYALARVSQEQCLFYSQCPIQVGRDRWLAVADFLMRVNYGMPMGNFEINMDDGDIRLKTGVDVEGDRLSPALFQGIVQANLAMMTRYLSGIVKVGLEEADPKAVFEAIDG